MPETITVTKSDRVVLVTLNRPKQLNALNAQLARELIETLRAHDSDPEVGCIVITGSERAFAAGADIAEMSGKTYAQMAADDFFAEWEEFANFRTPKIAAVNGYALGGGCELMMMCDFAIAGEGAKFGQPEIKLGVMAGIGGTQRMTKLTGRAFAMDLHLTGRIVGASEALQAGLVARVVPDANVLETAMAAAADIARYSKPVTSLVREAVNLAESANLSDGLLFERRTFHALFATQDQKEGMAAFLEKRAPVFKGT
jgi:enoyl-CoA hydratase